MKVTEIKHQSLGSILVDFQICQHCNIVDRDNDRIRVGYPCPNCSEPSPGGRSYFNISVYSLVNLMQEFFHAEYKITDDDGLWELQGTGNAKIAVVIFFTTLREVLLNNLLYELMIAQALPGNVCERLFSDNFTHKQRLDRLFPSLAGVKWKKAVKMLNEESDIDYVSLDTFIVKAVKARNKFLHQGSKWTIKKETPVECIKQIFPILNFHADLHNRFVYPIYNRKE